MIFMKCLKRLLQLLLLFVFVLLLGSSSLAEVSKTNDGGIKMSAEDYRIFIERITVLEAENTSLKKTIQEERASFELLNGQIISADQAVKYERLASDLRIESLRSEVARMRSERWWFLLLGGIGGALYNHD